jgi:hypothetical protein
MKRLCAISAAAATGLSGSAGDPRQKHSQETTDGGDRESQKSTEASFK